MINGLNIPEEQVLPSPSRLTPVGQAQLWPFGWGERRQTWLQPPLLTEQAERTVERKKELPSDAAQKWICTVIT